jgi:hypothetical protein
MEVRGVAVDDRAEDVREVVLHAEVVSAAFADP